MHILLEAGGEGVMSSESRLYRTRFSESARQLLSECPRDRKPYTPYTDTDRQADFLTIDLFNKKQPWALVAYCYSPDHTYILLAM